MMKPKTYGDWDVSFPVTAQIKYDGFLTIIFVENGTVKYFTSGMKEMVLNPDPFINFAEGVYFAEMLGTDGKLGDRQNCGRQTTYRANTAKGISNGDIVENWIVFEFVTHEEYAEGISVKSYSERVSEIPEDYLPVVWDVKNQKELDALFTATNLEGWEGLIVRDPDHEWVDGKRLKTFYRLKKVHTYDLKCIGSTEGEGRLEGMMGALILVDATGREVCSVGTGFTDADRRMEYEGKIIEVKCERISKDGILVMPRYVAIREPKELDTITRSTR